MGGYINAMGTNIDVIQCVRELIYQYFKVFYLAARPAAEVSNRYLADPTGRSANELLHGPSGKIEYLEVLVDQP